jgi:signal transduction histidine kinase
MRGVDRLARMGGRDVARLDVSLAVAVVLLLVVSAVAALGVDFPGVTDARALDIAINVAAILVGAAVAILAWVRWRETREPVALYESGAFVALTLTNVLMIGAVLGGRELEFGLSPDMPGEAPIYLWTITRLTAGFLLVIGATRSLDRQRPPLPPLVIALAPAVVLVIVALMLFGREAALPPVPGASAFDPAGPGPLALSPLSSAVLIVQVVIFAAFIYAAVLFRRLYLRDGLVSYAFLCVGLVVAAFSQLHFGLEPVVASGVVTSTDVLRLGFYAILFMGIQAEIEYDLTALRLANDELRRLGEVDLANAALAERTRLAREIHDGLAQDLWYAKLKQGRLIQETSLDENGQTTAREVLGALDSALAEARQAVMALRVDPTSGTLEEVLHAYVDDFADRFGVRAEFRADGTLERLPPRTEAEVLRIVQEALNNVRRHADATMVRVTTERRGDAVRVSIADNGKGFDPAAVGKDRYGLRGMRERAELVGAALEIDSRPADGTRVVLNIPTAEPAR